jgi:hypothetical protein
METVNKLHIANLDFILNYTDGKTVDEIEYEIFKASFQVKESVHYDRQMGGSFQNLEQEPLNQLDLISMTFGVNIVESIYLVNEEKGGDPYIVIGFSDITTSQPNPRETTIYVTVNWRLLNDLAHTGQINMEI